MRFEFYIKKENESISTIKRNIVYYDTLKLGKENPIQSREQREKEAFIRLIRETPIKELRNNYYSVSKPKRVTLNMKSNDGPVTVIKYKLSLL